MASGDKVYIADKGTLDEVNAKIGKTQDTGSSKTAGSIFAKLNAIISHLLTNWTVERAALINTTSSNVSAIKDAAKDIQEKVGTPDDAANTESRTIFAILKGVALHLTSNWPYDRALLVDKIDNRVQSLYDSYFGDANNRSILADDAANAHLLASYIQKKINELVYDVEQLSTAIDSINKRLKSYANHYTLTAGTHVIADLTGPGVFHGARAEFFDANCASQIIASIDGTQYSVTPKNGYIYLCRSYDGGAYPVATTTQDMFQLAAPIHFKKNFRLQVTVINVDSGNGDCCVLYDLYE